jgi:hypothetical protein
MSRKNTSSSFPFVLVSVALLAGCGAGPSSDPEEDLRTDVFAAVTFNALEPEALTEAGNIARTPLQPEAWSADDLAAITEPGEKGRLSRLFLQYAVSCALPAGESVSIAEMTFPGKHGLAPTWAEQPLDVEGQLWVSACMAARTNWYGEVVEISMRGGNEALALNNDEGEGFTLEEGAFWGNFFEPEPFARACYVAGNEEEARQAQRDCAAGHLETGVVEECGIIAIVGSCSDFCTSLGSGSEARACKPSGADLSSLAETQYVISVFLH